ncbi:MAG: ABC transporter permease [Firmicutes bacterium]|nr:ABC transporter permease [Bacillota bacterium]
MNNINKFMENFKESRISGVFIALLFIIIIASFVSPYFLTTYNIQSVIRSLAFVSIVAIGQACLLILGELDLSVGAIAGLSGVLGGMMMVNASINPYLAFILCLLIGAGFGFINGILVSGLNLNSLVVTVGMTGIYSGVNLVISKGKAITGIPEEIYFLGQGKLFGIPMPFIIMLVVLAVIVFITRYTPFGRYVYAIGNSKEAAKILGIRVNLVTIITFMIVGLLSALAGMVMVARLGSSQPSIGETWVMNSIASSVIGGVALTGGVGSPAGALLGAAVIGIINNIIVLFGVSPYWQTAVSGAIVVGAISIDSVSRMISRKKNH